MEQLEIAKKYFTGRYKKLGGKKTVGSLSWTDKDYLKETNKIKRAVKPFMEDIVNQQDVLDFGCGIGRWVTFLSKSFENYYGADITEPMLAEAIRKHRHKGFFKVIELDGVIPFGRQRFDLIWTCVVLQHLTDDAILQFYVKQFYDRLKNNGKIIIVENIHKATSNTYIKYRTALDYIEIFKDHGFILERQDVLTSAKEEHGVFRFAKGVTDENIKT